MARLKPEDCTGMDDIRREIDRLDTTIIELLGERFRYVKAAAPFKTSEDSVRAPDRFRAVLAERRRLAEANGLSPDVVEKLYRDLVEYFIQEEMKHWKEDA